MRRSRRALLAALGTGTLAGCLRLEGEETTRDELGSSTRTGTESTTETTRSPVDTETTTEEPEPVTALSGSWREFRANATKTGVGGAGPGPAASVVETWRSPLPEGIGAFSSPVVADGRAYVLADAGILGALDTVSGDLVWRRELPGDSDTVGSPAVVDGRVYVAPLDEPTLYALDAASGAFQWQTGLDAGAFASPTVVDGVVIVATTTGTVYAVDPDDGSVRWQYDTGGRTVLASPASTDGRLYVVSTTANELPDGVDDLFDLLYYDEFYRWGPIDEDPHATVASLDARAKLHVIDAASGDPIASRQFPDFVVSTPAVADDALFATCWDGRVYAFELGSGEERWIASTDAPFSGSPTVADGVLYAGNWNGTVHAFDVATGEKRWFLPVGSNVGASPAATDDGVYVTVEDGGVASIGTDGRVRWRFEDSAVAFDTSSPAVVDEALVVCADGGGPDATRGVVFRLDAE